ncbi:MAG: YybH family protein [Isosphaeraceae bacterium]
MRLRRTFRAVSPLALLIPALAIPGLAGDDPATRSEKAQTPAATRPDAAGATGQGQSDDEKGILAIDDAFVAAYNRGETKALAARFTEDAEVAEADGDRYQGRDAIERRFAETFAANPGVKIAIEIGSIRFLNPDLAKEEGRTLITPAKGAPLSRPYTAIFVKREGRWLFASIREESDPFIRPHDRLKDLEWMIGEWVDEGSDSVVRINCRWSEDQNFLIRSCTVKMQGKPVMSLTQRIGWDPLARQIRSWDFDSEGGFGEGRWSRDGDRWTIKHTGVRPEGTPTSSTNVMVRERPDVLRWVSTDRVLGEQSIPENEAYVMVRVPPAPRLRSKGPSAPASSPNTTRSPR